MTPDDYLERLIRHAHSDARPLTRSEIMSRVKRRTRALDHRNDRLDLVDLARERPEIVERLAEELEAWHQQALAIRLAPDAEPPQGLSREQLERLRSFGYIR